MLVELWSARIALAKLKEDTLALVRIARGYQAMKDLLHCYQIFDITDRINWPWESHPGKVFGDMAAFMDLQIVVERLMYFKVADQDKLDKWVDSINDFIRRWKAGIDNKNLSNLPKTFGIPRKVE